MSRSTRQRLRAIARRAMLDRGLAPDFPPAVLAEVAADRRGGPAAPTALRDLTALPWCSIDNDDTRDFDQLTVAQTADAGATRILVAVADVDSRVARRSAVDAHAEVNTTSVYTAAQVFPMLPEALSTDLTSLVEGETRLAIVVDMTVSDDGAVGASDLYRASVRNHAKLVYDSVAAWLDGRGTAPPRVAANNVLAEQLRTQDRVAQAMKRIRHRRGALTLETVESRAVFDGDALADLRPDEQNRAKALIEDFMIAANTATARFLDARGFASIRRVLRTPERWDRIVALAASLGERLPDAPDAAALEAFLVHRRDADRDRFCDLSLAIVKLLGNGEYALERRGERVDGHFGLAVRDYAHSTAPNRRYPDLVTQRLVKAALDGAPPPYGDDALAALARHCTEQEDNAAKVERQVRKSAAALLLEPRVGERFDAIVTGAAPKGTWVRIARPAIEGRLVRGFEGVDVGDRLRVRLVATDVERGFIDFERVAS